MSSLKIANSRIRDAVLNGVSKNGPATLRSNWAKKRYASPEGLDDVFNEAIKITTAESQRLGKLADELPDTPENKSQKLSLLTKQQYYSPEVHYNHLVNKVDLEQPVYRYLSRRDWHSREMLVLMQRIEQHHVIPDTLPTLDPRAKVEIKFNTPASRWIEPGDVVATNVSERLPVIKVTDFDNEGLYTILIVNPDQPDVENDTFTTKLVFGAVNVPISYNQNIADFAAEGCQIIQKYVPPHPDKNLPPQRHCVWVFRQSQKVSDARATDSFDIREFANAHGLDAVGAQLWRSKWDRMTPIIREKYGLGPGQVFYRARTAQPENALLHIQHRKQWRD